ncbi:MAG: hypothetical protein H7Y09_12135 [Chitinophagaceae bacterium]|nr:hypothetical protein [Anaerolineae bacterium]
MKWDWLTKPTTIDNGRFIRRVLIKAALLFILLDLAFALLKPLPVLGSLSLYNVILPGRDRLPYGESPAQDYSLSLNNLPAMFASHEINRPKAEDEFRVILLGDSSTWGWLLENDQTLAAHINAADLHTGDNRRIVAYNLGYPIMSLTKDLMLLDYAMQYHPDQIIWLVTLESFPREKQLYPPITQNNAPTIRRLIDSHDLNLDPNDPRLVEPDLLGTTLIGQRRSIADLFRLQLYGFAWANTGIDQYIPSVYPLRASDFDEDVSWQEYAAPQPLTEDDLAFDVLQAGIEMAGDVPILIVNEPMFISEGQNSDLRYNAFYPRWAYDAYHDLLIATAAAENWQFIDLWNILPLEAFTDSPVHTTSKGARLLAERLIPYIYSP